MIQKIVINKIVSLLAKQFKLYDVMKYVEEPNDADNRISELEIRLFQLGLRYEQFIAPTVRAVQELDDKVIALTTRVTTLES